MNWDQLWNVFVVLGGFGGLVTLLVKYFGVLKRHKKQRIYNSFEGSAEFLSVDEILRTLREKDRECDLDGEKFTNTSRSTRVGYLFRIFIKRVEGRFWTTMYSINKPSQVSPLLYELIEEGMLISDEKNQFYRRAK